LRQERRVLIKPAKTAGKNSTENGHAIATINYPDLFDLPSDGRLWESAFRGRQQDLTIKESLKH